MLTRYSPLFLFVWFTFIDLHLVTAQNINTPEYFPDPNFRSIVESFMGVSPGVTFTAQEAKVKTGILDCAFMDIQDMKGIEYFININELICYINSLTLLDLSKNVSLEKLDCSFNNIVTLILPPLSNIRILDCSFNQLTDISNLKTQPVLGQDGYIDIRYNQLTCDDWETILFLEDQIGEAVYAHDPDFGFDILVSGFAFSPQNDTDFSECKSLTPIQQSTATPTPSRTPTPSETPTPFITVKPTSIPCLKEPIINEFNQSELAANGLAEIPGGFIPNTSPGSFLFRDFTDQEYPESQDGKGLAVTVKPGQVTFLYALDAIFSGDSPVLLRLHARASSPAAQVVLVALKGSAGLWDGSLGVMSPCNTKPAMNQEFREVLLYQPDNEGVITPAIQVMGLSMDNNTTVLIDCIEIIPINHPLFSSTGVNCDSSFMRIPDPVILYDNDFSAESLQLNSLGEIPGGFTDMVTGKVRCGDFLSDRFISSKDKKGLTITVRSGQVEFIYLTPALNTYGYPLLLKMNVHADSPDVSIALGALKGDLATNQYVDGSIAYQIPAGADAFIQQERQIVILYEPDEGSLVTPIIQAAAAVNAEDVNVFIDSFEVYALDREIFAYNPSGETEPTLTPAYTPTHTPTPTEFPKASPTPVIPVVVDGATGGTITLSDQAGVEIPAGFTHGEVNVAFGLVANSLNQRTDEYAVVSGEYELSITAEGDFNSDLVLVLPVENNEWRDSLDLSLAGAQYFDEAGRWMEIFGRIK